MLPKSRSVSETENSEEYVRPAVKKCGKKKTYKRRSYSSESELSQDSEGKPIASKKKPDQIIINPLAQTFNTNLQKTFQAYKHACCHGQFITKTPSKNSKAEKKYACTFIMDNINEAINKNYVISDINIKHFYALINKGYGKRTCFVNNGEKIIEFTKNLFEYQMPPIDVLKSLIELEKYDSCYECIFKNKNFTECKGEFISLIAKNRLKNSVDDSTDETLCNIIINNTNNYSFQNLLDLCGCSNNIITSKVSQIIDNLDIETFDSIFTNKDQFMKTACKNTPYAINIITSVANKNVQINAEYFGIICKHGNYENLKYILELSRTPVTQEHFRIVLDTFRQYKSYVTDEEDDDGNTDLKKGLNKIELLFQNGFIPSRDDIYYSIKYNIMIPNIERFDNIVMDKDMYTCCIENNFYPKYKFNCISSEMFLLQGACYMRDVSLVKKLIKMHKLVPDEICMENCSKYREATIFPNLIKAGGKVNLKCVKNVSKSYANNKFIKQYLNEYEKEYMIEITNYKNKIAELEKCVTGTKVDNIEIQRDKQPIVDVVEVKYNILNLDIDNDKILQCRLKYKNKRVPHQKIIEFFNINGKQKVSYSDFKKLLFEKIQEESWACESDKKLIKVPLKYRSMFGFSDNDNDVISFDNVEKLIYLFYVNNCEVN